MQPEEKKKQSLLSWLEIPIPTGWTTSRTIFLGPKRPRKTHLCGTNVSQKPENSYIFPYVCACMCIYIYIHIKNIINHLYMYIYLYIYIYIPMIDILSEIYCPPSLFGVTIAGFTEAKRSQLPASVFGLVVHDGSRLVLQPCDGVI